MKRHDYARVYAVRFRQMLSDLGHPDGSRFAYVYGVPPARVKSWMNGDEDIPHAAHVMLDGFLQIPGSFERAVELTNRVARPTDRERERRQAFAERKRREGGDNGKA